MTDTEPEQPAGEPETQDVEPAAEGLNVNGEVIDEALINSYVVEVQYWNPADPDGPEGPEGPPEG